MDFLVMLTFIIAVNWFCLTLVWLISLKIKDVGIVDIYWGIGFFIMFSSQFAEQSDSNFPKPVAH